MTNFNRYDWDDREQVLLDLKRSTSMSDFLINIGLGANPGNCHTFKRKIQMHNIDLTNIYKARVRKVLSKVRVNKQKLIHDEIFSESSPCSREYVKAVIKKYKLLPYICAGCGNLGVWQNKPLTLQLEHKNGLNTDNRLSNLEYLCPNCHNQTSTYGSKNKQILLLNKRLKILKENKINEITDEKIEEIALLWKIRFASVLDWCIKHKEKLSQNFITYNVVRGHDRNKKIKIERLISESIITSNNLEDFAKKLNIEKEKAFLLLKVYSPITYNKILNESVNHKEINARLKDLQHIDIQNCVENLSKKWKLTPEDVKSWLKEHDNILYKKIIETEDVQKNLTQQLLALAQVASNKAAFDPRFQQLSLLTNKKQVPTLAKSWNTSINGAKKWIKNNAPEKFAEIYDDALLEKNKVAALKIEKLDYIKSLTIDNFDLNDFIRDYGGNKSGAYSLLSKYNKDLLAHISKTPDCIHCTGKTRTSGTTIKAGETIQRYRCVDCDKSFSMAAN